MTRPMMNEFCDVVSARATELGYFADHAQGAPVREESLASELFEAMATATFQGKGTTLEDAGARVLMMAYVMGRLRQRDFNRLPAKLRHRAKVHAWRGLSMMCFDAKRQIEVVMLFLGTNDRERGATQVGRRASLLTYALTTNSVVHEMLPNLESLGRAWQLRAHNKRSAVCAAMNGLREELISRYRLPAGFRFWFEKQPDARLVYREAQMGNTNRLSGGHDETRMQNDEAEEPEMATAAARERWEAAEMRRLGRLGIPRGSN